MNLSYFFLPGINFSLLEAAPIPTCLHVSGSSLQAANSLGVAVACSKISMETCSGMNADSHRIIPNTGKWRVFPSGPHTGHHLPMMEACGGGLPVCQPVVGQEKLRSGPIFTCTQV